MKPQTTAEAAEIGGECALVKLFVDGLQTASRENRVAFNADSDRVVTEFAMRWGRADVVVFHGDGSVTVVEAKDGANGYQHVASGIGQVTLYAAQLSMSGTVRKVRRALLWSSTGSAFQDAALEVACESAGVIPLPWPSMRDTLAVTRAVLERLVSEAS